MNKYPKISIITPSYNQAQFLERTIQSVLDQDYSNLEWIVMDGGSTDGSVEIIQKYEPYFTHWQSEKDNGQSAAINAGMAKATGDVCCWLNSDDLFVDGALSQVGKYFQEHTDCQWLVCGGELRDIKGKTLRVIEAKSVSFEGLVTNWGGNRVNQPSVFWRRELWEKAGGLREELHLTMDYDLWLNFSQLDKPHSLDINVAVTVIHDDAKSVSLDVEQYVEMCLLLKEHGREDICRQKLVMHVKRAFWLYKVFNPLLSSTVYKKFKALIK